MSATNPSVNHYGAVTGQPNVYYPGRRDAKPKRNVTPVYASSHYVTCKTFGSIPTEFNCPFCNAQHVTSYLKHTNGVLVWIVVAILFLLFCWICICIPCLIKKLKDVEHYCPYCHNKVGVFLRANN